MKMKRIASTLLAGAMVMSMSATALAADDDTAAADPGVVVTDVTKATNLKITGETQLPVVKVTVPSTGKVIVNPYKMTVTVGEDELDDKVISATQFIKNESNIDIAVNATVTGTVGGEVKFATASATAATDKSVYMYFQMVSANDDENATFAAFDNTKDVVLSAKATAVPTAGVVTMKAATYSGSGADATVTVADAGGYAAFHLGGDCGDKLAKGNWTAKDTVSATIAFTFVPQAGAAAADEGADE